MGKFIRKHLGDILVEASMITEEQLHDALTEQRTCHKRLGQILIEKELLTEEKLVELLEKQLGIDQVNLYNFNIDSEVATSIPAHMARRHLVIPIEKGVGIVKLAMADPMNIIAIDDVEMLTGQKVEPVLASESSIIHTIEQFFSLAETLSEDSSAQEHTEEEIAQLRALVEEAPIVRVVNSMIHQAVAEEASDIHIEPLEKGVRVRMRIDGILHDLMTPPKDTQALLVSRIKIMANLDIAERRMPQDGRITIQVGLKDVNMRVSTMPTIHGEKVVIRILDREKVVLSLDKLGFSEDNYQTFLNFLLSHTGMLLVTGPTGSGKTTTLYSALNYLNRTEDNLITVEDPVEYRLDGINQVQVNPRIKLTFASALRTILRQDPNIIMIGEIRDLETAEMATRAALTGHLVLSTLHTNDASSTVTRLLDMGVDSYLITSSLIGVVAQRLVRKICDNCREEYRLSDQEQALFSNTFNREPPEILQRGQGCRECNETGYRGRFAIHEMMPMHRELIRLTLERASADVLREKALQLGMIPLLQEGLHRIETGETTIEEIVRVAYSSSGNEELAEPVPVKKLAAPSPPEPAEEGPPAEAAAGPDFTDQLNPAAGPNPEPREAPAEAPEPREAPAEVPVARPAPAVKAVKSGRRFERKAVAAARPGINLSLEGPVAASPGETIAFHFNIINSGTVELAGVRVTAPLFGQSWCFNIGNLGVGRASAFSFNYTVPAGSPPVLENEARVTGSAGTTEISAVTLHRVRVTSSFAEDEYLQL